MEKEIIGSVVVAAEKITLTQSDIEDAIKHHLGNINIKFDTVESVTFQLSCDSGKEERLTAEILLKEPQELTICGGEALKEFKTGDSVEIKLGD